MLVESDIFRHHSRGRIVLAATTILPPAPFAPGGSQFIATAPYGSTNFTLKNRIGRAVAARPPPCVAPPPAGTSPPRPFQ